MPMKVSLALGARQPLSSQTAWGCLTTNLTMPGFGSLVAGRASGYGQAALALGGTIISVVFGGRFIFWYVANWSRFHASEADPMAALGEMWLVLRWPVLGIGIFCVGWVWALATSLQILRSSKKPAPASVPPRLW